MRNQRLTKKRGKYSVLMLGMLAMSNFSSAEPYEFKVVYAQVPGIEKALAGDLDAAIASLELRAQDSGNVQMPGELATLCALYVVTGKLEDGQMTCNAAVENNEGDIAYNNRGVLRTRLGDATGALQDFARVRVLPDDERAFFEDLKRRNASLMASRNFLLVTKYIDRLLANERSNTGSEWGASIEELKD